MWVLPIKNELNIENLRILMVLPKSLVRECTNGYYNKRSNLFKAKAIKPLGTNIVITALFFDNLDMVFYQ